MPAPSQRASRGPFELGALLALLHGADGAFHSVEVTWRVWQPETEATVRIWRDGDRCREEHHGGPRDGYYAVADGPRWWMWGERMGARSNQDDQSVSGNVGRELEIMLDPTPLLSALRFRVTGSSEFAGRPTVTAHATPRMLDPRHGRSRELHQLGTGAQEYELQVDRERGVLLAATAIRDGQPFYTITARSIRFDQPIAEARFQFTPPDGEEVQPLGNHPRLRRLTLTEAQQRASFTVLMPDRVPAGWQVSCTFFEPSERSPSPVEVSLGYRSGDGHESISISQMAIADRVSHHYENVVNDENWHQTTVDGTRINVRPDGFGQAQAHLEREGTFAFLVSDNLTNEQLGAIAGGLRAAPSTSSI